jgi:exodeoxyribonuclease V alpha subunit
LGEATLQFARTIHRLLEFKPEEGGYFARNAENPIYADMIVIDEASMLDLSLFHHLLKATHVKTHLLIVGDPDQLPSVGAGDVLHDLIRSGKFPVTRLDHIFRQAEGSSIITNAHLINAGKMPTLDMKPDWVFVEAPNPLAVQFQIVDLVCNKLPAKGFDPVHQVQVLLPMYKGDAGVNELNQLLRARLNPPKGGVERKFRTGDKVMQLKNNYQLDVFNGDTGFVQEWDADEGKLMVEIDGRRVGYESSAMDQLTLAYACTIHKSQGSEYPVVIVGMTSAHYIMLKRNLLYTGITRGRQVVILVGDKRAIGMAVSHADTAKRYTRLVSRLNG